MAQDPAQIIASLEKQFNGNPEHDLAVLSDYCASLPHCDDSIPIVTAIGDYVLKHFPDTQAAQDGQRFEAAFDEFYALIGKAQECMKNRQYQEAVDIFNSIISDVKPPENPDIYFFAFSHPFEEMLARAMHTYDDRRIERIPQLPEMLYYQQGCALFELKKYDEARSAFQCALKLNPVSCRTYFELIQVEKICKHFDTVRSLLNKVHQMIFNRHFLSRFYREHANLAILDHKNELAVALLHVSLDYEDSPHSNVLMENLKKENVCTIAPTVDEIKDLLTKADIPVGPYPGTYELALRIGKQMKPVHPEAAKMAFSIAYDLTHFKPILDEMK